MPWRAKRPCREPGCAGFAEKGEVYCEKHRKAYERQSADKRGYNAAWRRAREIYLARNPLCVMCAREGRLTPATVVDHIIPHRGDSELFWNTANWQSLCKKHHDEKTGSGL